MLCPVDRRWTRGREACPDCGSSLAPLQSLNRLAASLLDTAAGTSPGAAAGLVDRAAELVPASEDFLLSCAAALESAGAFDLAAERVVEALAIAPRREDLVALAAALHERAGRDQPSRARGVQLATGWRGWASAAATVTLLLVGAAAGTLVAGQSDSASAGARQTIGTASPATTSSQAALLPPSPGLTASPGTSALPSKSAPPGPSLSPLPTAAPASAPDVVTAVRRAIAEIPSLADSPIAVEMVDGVVRVSGPVQDAKTLRRAAALITATVAGLPLDLSGLIAPRELTIVVQPGDTMWSIAARLFADPRKWHDLAAANPRVNPQALRVGQRLVVP